MDTDPLNFFQPFHRLPPRHENQLTRALLVVLRLSPMAHTSWLRLAAPDIELSELPEATFATQRRAIHDPTDDDESAPLISVFLSPEKPLSEGEIEESDRAQILDAVIEYPGRLIVVVESKIVDAEDLQARRLNVTGARVTIQPGQEARVVVWRDLIERFGQLLERNLLAGAEARVVEDFLTFVEDHFGSLGPFRNLALCHGNRFRIDRRLRSLLSDAARTDARSDATGPQVPFLPNSDAVAAMAYLKVSDDDEAIELAIYPADTLGQARIFYRRPKTVEAARTLAAQPGWTAKPMFHFGHMQRGFAWTLAERPLDEYLEVWQDRIDDAHAIPRADWDQYWAWLLNERFAAEDDRPEFDRHFTATKRQDATPRPGIEIARRWPLEDAEKLDAAGKLEAEVATSLDAARVALRTE